jgi:hypothetical protein
VSTAAGSISARPDLEVAWTARGFDTISRRPESVVARMVRRIGPGAIILVHESNPRVSRHVEILARLLDHLRRQNYACVIPPAARLRT